ncbi:MAG: hypothetical protein ACFFDN_44125, partial [Candidatus Hodarchaeota archaeon]
ELDFLKNYISEYPLNEVIVKWANYQIIYGCAADLMRYSWEKAALTHENIREIELPESYYDFFDKFKIDCKEASISSTYFEYLEAYDRYISTRPIKNSEHYYFKDMVQIILNEAERLSEDDREKLVIMSGKNTQTFKKDEVEVMRRISEQNRALYEEKIKPQFSRSMIKRYFEILDDYALDAILSKFYYLNLEKKNDIEILKEYFED